MNITEGSSCSRTCDQNAFDSVKIETDVNKLVQQAMECEEREPKKALWLYHLAEDGGCTEAITRQGILYLSGQGGIPKDERRAIELFTMAAKKGDSEANAWLGKAYLHGLGELTPNPTKARKKFKKARDSGSIEGMAWHGKMLLKGDESGRQEGLSLIRKAADSGNANGMYFLGKRYEIGKAGITRDREQAKQLFLQAAQLGHAKAMDWLSGIFSEDNNTTAQGQRWLERAAALGHRKAIQRLACSYACGVGGYPQDDAKAFRFFQKLFDLGPKIKGKQWYAGDLSVMYENGRGIAKDLREARRVWVLSGLVPSMFDINHTNSTP